MVATRANARPRPRSLSSATTCSFPDPQHAPPSPPLRATNYAQALTPRDLGPQSSPLPPNKHAAPAVCHPPGPRTMSDYDDYGMPVGAYSEPESLPHQAWRVARAFVIFKVKPAAEKKWNELRRGNWTWRSWFSLVKVLCLIWLVVVYRGERSAIRNSVDACRWETWENWVCITSN